MTARKKIAIGAAAAVAILLVLAIAVPNFQLERTVGPSTMAASTIRTIIAAEGTYSTAYPGAGYAPNLLVLGPADSENCDSSHACLLDAVVACSAGTGQGWCRKSLYRYNVQSSSTKPPYKDYWITVTPVEANPRLRNYCSLSDAVMRSEQAAPRIRPYTLEECQAVPYDPDGYHS